MKIKNLTPDVQKLVVREITGEKKTYDVYVVPHGTTDIEKMSILEPKDISGIFEIEGMVKHTTISIPVDMKTPEVDSPALTISVHDEDETPPVVPEQENEDSFVCEICKAEFGSARGLNSHKNRAHPDN